jgi:hypothetical protein
MAIALFGASDRLEDLTGVAKTLTLHNSKGSMNIERFRSPHKFEMAMVKKRSQSRQPLGIAGPFYDLPGYWFTHFKLLSQRRTVAIRQDRLDWKYIVRGEQRLIQDAFDIGRKVPYPIT